MRTRANRVGGAIAALSLLLSAAALVSCGPPPQQQIAAPVQVAQKQLTVTGAGAALERLTSEDVTELHPAISPDGATLLFEVRVYTEGQDAPKTQTLVAINPNTRAQRTLYTSDSSRADHPAWLPDGTSYVYASDSPGNWSLVKALTASPNAAIGVIATGEIAPEVSWPTVAPDGKRVAFSMRVRNSVQIAVIGSDGSHLTLLGDGNSPSWSPDGSRLAFARQVGDHQHLFLVNPNTGTDLVQLTSGDFDHETPAWSPDGRYLTFSSTRGWKKDEGESKRFNLFVISRDGTGLTQFTSGDTFAKTPYWGRDNWIYFASDQAGNFDIWRLKPAGAYGNLPYAGGVAAVTPPPAAPEPEKKGTTAAPTATAPTPPPPVATPFPAVSSPAAGQCSKDTDCKGDRICEAGQCISPKPAPKRGH